MKRKKHIKKKRVVSYTARQRELSEIANKHPSWRFHPDTGEKLLPSGESLEEFQSRMRS